MLSILDLESARKVFDEAVKTFHPEKIKIPLDGYEKEQSLATN